MFKFIYYSRFHNTVSLPESFSYGGASSGGADGGSSAPARPRLGPPPVTAHNGLGGFSTSLKERRRGILLRAALPHCRRSQPTASSSFRVAIGDRGMSAARANHKWNHCFSSNSGICVACPDLCLFDETMMTGYPGTGRVPMAPVFSSCRTDEGAHLVQGLSAGWQITYSRDASCMYLDITGLVLLHLLLSFFIYYSTFSDCVGLLSGPIRQ